MVVEAGRLKLRAERLKVRRRPDGALEVEGPVVASACACDPPAVSVEAARLVVTDRGEVRATDASLRLFGARALPLPWLSLRSPSQVGLLPPTLAWRAADGPFAGAGAHVPLGAARSLDLHTGAYLRGTGVDSVATLDTERARLRARWERLHGDRVTLAGRASVPGAEAVNASIDVVRGPGVGRAALDLDSAARPRDRLDVAVGAGTAGVSAFAYAPRGLGRAWSGLRVVAPVELAARSGSLSVVGDALSLASSGQAVSVARARALATAGGFVGIVRMDLRADAAAWVASEASGGGVGGASGSLAVGVGVPVARAVGGGWVHVVDPGLRAAVFAADERGAGASFAPSVVARGRAGLVSLALASSLGPPGRGVASASIEPGLLATADRVEPLARARLGARGDLARAELEGAVVARGALYVARADLGPRALFARAGLESLHGSNPVETRALGLDDAARARWFATDGTTVRAGLGGSSGALFADASRVWGLPGGVALADEARVGYRPRCLCLEVTALGARRLGRDGVDVAVSVALFR